MLHEKKENRLAIPGNELVPKVYRYTQCWPDMIPYREQERAAGEMEVSSSSGDVAMLRRTAVVDVGGEISGLKEEQAEQSCSERVNCQ